jgi:hypothetical protein
MSFEDTAKIVISCNACKHFRGLKLLMETYGNLMPLMATYLDKRFVYIADFCYLCIDKINVESDQINRIMNEYHHIRTYGRMELAQAYFPYITARSAWKKLKSLLQDDPRTVSLTQLSRRTFLPTEVSRIFSTLGIP